MSSYSAYPASSRYSSRYAYRDTSGRSETTARKSRRHRRRRSLASRIENALEWLGAIAVLLTGAIAIFFCALALLSDYLPSDTGMVSVIGTAALALLLLLVHRHYRQHGPPEEE